MQVLSSKEIEQVSGGVYYDEATRQSLTYTLANGLTPSSGLWWEQQGFGPGDWAAVAGRKSIQSANTNTPPAQQGTGSKGGSSCLSAAVNAASTALSCAFSATYNITPSMTSNAQCQAQAQQAVDTAKSACGW